jgi:membrane-associated phospholipid phosphatase
LSMRSSVGLVVLLLVAAPGGAAHAQDLRTAAPGLSASDPASPPTRLDDPQLLFAIDPPAAAASDAGPSLEEASRQVISQPAGPPPTPRHTGIHALGKDLVDDLKHLPSKENLFWAGLGGGLALAVHPIDDNVMHAWGGNSTMQNVFKLGKYLGQSYVLIPVAATVYIYGRSKDEPKVSHVGMDLIEALLISEGIVQTLKYTTRRERPDDSGKTSFPSGHAADTFAFATAFERHIGWKGAVPAYIFASYVAISRIPDNRHWLSDTIFGASVGIIAGRTVTRHGAKFPFEVAAVRGGAEIMFVRNGK